MKKLSNKELRFIGNGDIIGFTDFMGKKGYVIMVGDGYYTGITYEPIIDNKYKPNPKSLDGVGCAVNRSEPNDHYGELFHMRKSQKVWIQDFMNNPNYINIDKVYTFKTKKKLFKWLMKKQSIQNG